MENGSKFSTDSLSWSGYCNFASLFYPIFIFFVFLDFPLVGLSESSI